MLSKQKTKKVIFYILWALILWYLYIKFAESKPFGKNSSFYKESCKNKNTNIKTDKLIKLQGF